MNNNGSSMLLFVWLLLMSVLIAGALFIGVSINNVEIEDVRIPQTLALSDRIFESMMINGEFDERALNENILELSNIDSGLFEKDMYLGIEIYNMNGLVRSVSYGLEDYKINCWLPGDSLPYCLKRDLFLGEVNISVVAGSNYLGGIR